MAPPTLENLDEQFADDATIVADATVGLWLAFTVSQRESEAVVVRWFDGGEAVVEHRFEHSFRPALSASKNGCTAAMVSLEAGRLVPRVVLVGRDGALREIELPSQGDALGVDVAGNWVVWDEAVDGRMRVRVQDVAGDAASELPADGWLRSPALASDGGWLACVEGRFERRIALFGYDGARFKRVATTTDTTAEAPAIAAVGDDVYVAWHVGVGDGLRWLRAARLVDGELQSLDVPEPPQFSRTDAPTDQGWEFPALHVSDTGVVLAGRSAHNFHVSRLEGGQFGPRVSQAPDGWGGCGRKSALARVDGELLFARAQRRKLVVAPVQSTAEPLPLGRPAYEPHELGPPAARPGSQLSERIQFGQIHQHSAHSDGTGTVWDMLARSVREGLRFASMTDHDVFCGKALGPATWRAMCVVADLLNSAELSVLHAVEFTGARDPGPGHKNLYFEGSPPAMLFEHTREGLAQTLAESPAIVIPHHVGFTGWDIDDHTAEQQPLWEICSVHGIYEGDPETAQTFPPRNDAHLEGHTLRAALDRGLKFGFCAGADDHGLLYHHGTTPRRNPIHTGLTAVIDAEPTRRGILEALRARRCYATTGAQIELEVTLDGHPMGAEVELDGPALLRVRAHGTAPIEAVDILTSEGDQTIELGESTSVDLEREIDLQASGYVYVRVRQVDHDIAWSSPVFLNERRAAKRIAKKT